MDEETLTEVSETLLTRTLAWLGSLEPSEQQILGLLMVALVCFGLAAILRAWTAHQRWTLRKHRQEDLK